jgi:large subunit ribosomal protein L19
MRNALIEHVEKSSLKPAVPVFHIGDTVDVHTRIVEGDKERIQVFNGVVIARRGAGVNEKFTVRRIVANEGVERTFLVHSPNVVDIKIRRRGKVRRAKLYYLRHRLGKARKVRELRITQKPTEEPAALAAATA